MNFTQTSWSHHHAAEQQEHVTGRKRRNHPGKKRREQGHKDPMREAAEHLPFGAMAIRKNLGDEHPRLLPCLTPGGNQGILGSMQLLRLASVLIVFAEISLLPLQAPGPLQRVPNTSLQMPASPPAQRKSGGK